MSFATTTWCPAPTSVCATPSRSAASDPTMRIDATIRCLLRARALRHSRLIPHRLRSPLPAKNFPRRCERTASRHRVISRENKSTLRWRRRPWEVNAAALSVPCHAVQPIQFSTRAAERERRIVNPLLSPSRQGASQHPQHRSLKKSDQEIRDDRRDIDRAHRRDYLSQWTKDGFADCVCPPNPARMRRDREP